MTIRIFHNNNQRRMISMLTMDKITMIEDLLNNTDKIHKIIKRTVTKILAPIVEDTDVLINVKPLYNSTNGQINSIINNQHNRYSFLNRLSGEIREVSCVNFIILMSYVECISYDNYKKLFKECANVQHIKSSIFKNICNLILHTVLSDDSNSKYKVTAYYIDSISTTETPHANQNMIGIVGHESAYKVIYDTEKWNDLNHEMYRLCSLYYNFFDNIVIEVEDLHDHTYSIFTYATIEGVRDNVIYRNDIYALYVESIKDLPQLMGAAAVAKIVYQANNSNSNNSQFSYHEDYRITKKIEIDNLCHSHIVDRCIKRSLDRIKDCKYGSDSFIYLQDFIVEWFIHKTCSALNNKVEDMCAILTKEALSNESDLSKIPVGITIQPCEFTYGNSSSTIALANGEYADERVWGSSLSTAKLNTFDITITLDPKSLISHTLSIHWNVPGNKYTVDTAKLHTSLTQCLNEKLTIIMTISDKHFADNNELQKMKDYVDIIMCANDYIDRILDIINEEVNNNHLIGDLQSYVDSDIGSREGMLDQFIRDMLPDTITYDSTRDSKISIKDFITTVNYYGAAYTLHNTNHNGKLGTICMMCNEIASATELVINHHLHK